MIEKTLASFWMACSAEWRFEEAFDTKLEKEDVVVAVLFVFDVA